MFNKKIAALAVAAIGSLAAAQVQATPVGLELALLMDVSGSVDTNEFNLQKSGYVNAFNDAAIQAAIAGTPGGVAVTLFQWSSGNEQQQSVGWTHLTDAASASAFAAAINGITRAFSGSTAPGSAINVAAPTFTNNNFEGSRLVIDVSGDGSQNDGDNTLAARNAALLGSATQDAINAINGLPILGSEANLLSWYQNNIQGGTNSFTLAAASFADFESAVATKLEREITGVPEPMSLALMGTALAGLFGLRRRQSV